MININKSKINKILDRGVIVGVLPSIEAFRNRLLSGDKLKFYIGADPTSTALHLSHAKNYMLLEEFRKLGHEVIVLIGDFTARIGDPSDKTATRKQLSRKDVIENIKSWLVQIKPFMDFTAKKNPPLIKYNHDWLSKLTMEDVIKLASHFTVQRMLERDMFEKRIKMQKPIFVHEFMYPLMQGYDSVAMDVDVEMCGTDQTFNALAGRTLLRKMKGKEKFVLMVNLMENPITKELMSKSRGTGVFLNSNAFNMYGSIMSQPDEMIEIFLVNNTRIPLSEVKNIKEMKNQRDAKMLTAFEITRISHGIEKAEEAQKKFVKLVQEKKSIDNVPIVILDFDSMDLFAILRACIGEFESNSQIRRLVDQSAVKINGKVVRSLDKIFSISNDGFMVTIGKKRWFKIVKSK